MPDAGPPPSSTEPYDGADADRERRAVQRDHAADERDRLMSARDRTADRRAAADPGVPGPDSAESAPASRAPAGDTERGLQPSADDQGTDGARSRDWAAEKREFVADERQHVADVREKTADVREAFADDHQQVTLTTVARAELEEARSQRSTAERKRALVDDAREHAALPRPLARELLELTRALSTRGGLDQSLQHVVDLAERIAEQCDAVSYTQKDGESSYSTLASTSAEALAIDEVQYRTGKGPCIDAAETAEPVVSTDLATDDRWPTLTAELAATVARSVMSTPVADDQLEQTLFGSLNHYGPKGASFDSDDIESATLLGAHLATLLSMRAAHAGETAQMREAILTRDIIGQAKGILMVRQGIAADEAFDILRRASQRLNRKLRDVALDITLNASSLPEETTADVV